jgi:hypothetical protein
MDINAPLGAAVWHSPGGNTANFLTLYRSTGCRLPVFDTERDAMTQTFSNSGRARRVGVFLLMALALLALAAMWRTTGRMKAEAAQFQSLKRGEAAKVVVEVTGMQGAEHFAGNLLEKNTETVYRRTTTPVEVMFDSQTAFAMGKAVDVRKGAVVYVTGSLEGNHSVHARQLVILSEYVSVK